MLLFSACAYMDNTHLQSAESIPAGRAKLQLLASTSYNFIPALPLNPDSLSLSHTTYPVHRAYAMALAYPCRLSIGLGRGIEIGGQMFVYPTPKEKHPGLEEWDNTKLGIAGKAYIKLSSPIIKNKRISIAPTAITNQGTILTNRHVLYTHDITGWEVPLTLSVLGTHKDESRGKSFTLRYSESKVNGSIWVENHWPWEQVFYPDQPNQTIEKYAFIYTYHFNQGKQRKYFDVGFEVTNTPYGLMCTPVFGMSWELSPKKWENNGKD